MKELKFLNKFLYKYRIKLIIGFFITVTARIFALIAPNLVGNSITLIENYVLSSSIDLDVLKERLVINILLINWFSFNCWSVYIYNATNDN